MEKYNIGEHVDVKIVAKKEWDELLERIAVLEKKIQWIPLDAAGSLIRHTDFKETQRINKPVYFEKTACKKFYPDSNFTSATICSVCGKQKFLHDR